MRVRLGRRIWERSLRDGLLSFRTPSGLTPSSLLSKKDVFALVDGDVREPLASGDGDAALGANREDMVVFVHVWDGGFTDVTNDFCAFPGWGR